MAKPIGKISFHIQENYRFTLKNKTLIRNWIRDVVTEEKGIVDSLSYIFCSDEYLLAMNKEYLQHDYYTDIITFDYSSTSNKKKLVSGDLFISVDRVTDNAKQFGALRYDELIRVIIHGVLHLLGYGDKTKSQQAIMRKKENYYIDYYRRKPKDNRV